MFTVINIINNMIMVTVMAMIITYIYDVTRVTPPIIRKPLGLRFG